MIVFLHILNTNLTKLSCGWVNLVSNGSGFTEAEVTLKIPYNAEYTVVVSPLEDINPNFNRANFYVRKIDLSHFRVCLYRENEEIASGASIKVAWMAFVATQ